MRSRDSWKQEHDTMLVFLDKARQKLQKYPNVAVVDIGIKEIEKN